MPGEGVGGGSEDKDAAHGDSLGCWNCSSSWGGGYKNLCTYKTHRKKSEFYICQFKNFFLNPQWFNFPHSKRWCEWTAVSTQKVRESVKIYKVPKLYENMRLYPCGDTIYSHSCISFVGKTKLKEDHPNNYHFKTYWKQGLLRRVSATYQFCHPIYFCLLFWSHSTENILMLEECSEDGNIF